MTILREAAKTLFDDQLLQSSRPKDVHHWVHPDQVLDEAGEEPNESAPGKAARWVLAVALGNEHDDAVDEAVGLHAKEDH